MRVFQYKITKHPAEMFSHLVFFCSDKGECSLNNVPGEQTQILEAILSQEGEEGWELVQVNFGSGGILIFWKKSVDRE